MSNLNSRPVLRAKWLKSLFDPGTNLGSYPKFIQGIGWSKEANMLHRVAFTLYKDLEIDCPIEILQGIWVNELEGIISGLIHRHPGITEDQLRVWMNRLALVIKQELIKLNSFDPQCIVNALQLKVLTDIKQSRDTSVEVRGEFYPYKTDVLAMAKNKKQKEFHQQQSQQELMFGIELEFSHSPYPLSELYPLMNMGIFKLDYSVDGEYVTLPYTYGEMVNKLNSLSKTLDKLLSANGSDRNGMHVHVSRNALSKDHILNLQWLLNPDTEDGKQYWSLVADRELENNPWSSFTDIHQWSTIGGGGFYDCKRSVILNLTNKHTVEFRMFKSPDNYLKVLWNLQVVKGLIEFSKDSSSLEEWIKSPLNPMNS